jgi:hypothetical protein
MIVPSRIRAQRPRAPEMGAGIPGQRGWMAPVRAISRGSLRNARVAFRNLANFRWKHMGSLEGFVDLGLQGQLGDLEFLQILSSLLER